MARRIFGSVEKRGKRYRARYESEGRWVWSAATGAPLAELMRRGGHKDSRAVVRYQQATRDSGKVLADALAALASHEVPSNTRVEAVPTESNGTAALDTSEPALRSAR